MKYCSGKLSLLFHQRCLDVHALSGITGLRGKFDPHAVKCIFIVFSPGQKDYKCWSASERRTFVRMDVNSRESELFYGERPNLSSLFDFDTPSINDLNREGQNEVASPSEGQQPRVVIYTVPFP